MEYDVLNKVITAARKHNLATNFNTMTNIRLWDNERSRIIMDQSIDGCWCFRSSNSNAGAIAEYGRNNIAVYNVKADCVSECSVGGSKKDVMAFAKDVGINLSEDDLKVINDINKFTQELYPETGDYKVFKKLTDEEIAKLSEDEKKAYDEALKIEEEKEKGTYLRKGVAAQITV